MASNVHRMCTRFTSLELKSVSCINNFHLSSLYNECLLINNTGAKHLTASIFDQSNRNAEYVEVIRRMDVGNTSEYSYIFARGASF